MRPSSNHTPPVSWRGETVVAIALGAIALVPRLALLSATEPAPPLYDMAEYWDRAVFMMQNGRLYENSTRMPGYPAALAAVLTVARAGPSLDAAHLFNAFAGAIAAMLTYWLARRSAGRAASFVAAVIVAVYPSLVIYTALTATEAVVAVPLLGALIAATYPSPAAAIASGVCAGLTVLVRPAGVALLPAVLVAVTVIGVRERAGAKAIGRLSLVIAAFALTMAPWWLHNVRLHGRFVPLDASGGINMAIGNNPHASGTYRYREARHLYALKLTPVEIATPDSSDRATEYAVQYIAAHPRHFLRLIPPKLAALLALEGRELAHIYSTGFFGPRDAPTVNSWAAAVVFSFPPLLVAALGGLTVRRGLSIVVLAPALVWIAASAAMHTLSFGDPRYHLPMVPVLAVFATGLARVGNGVSRVRLTLAVFVLFLLAAAWAQQFGVYRQALPKIAAPGGWNSQIPYDDLL